MDTNDIKMMDALFKAYNTAFSRAMRDSSANRDGTHGVMLDEIANTITSNTGTTEHAWLNQIASMRQWIGERVIRTLDFGLLKVTNLDYENTVEVGVNSVEDDQYGLFTPLIAAMGDACGRLWMELAVKALVSQSNWADGFAFFAKNRRLSTEQTALITNGTTATFDDAAVRAALVTMQSYMLARDAPAQVTPRYILVGPSLMDKAQWLFERELTVNPSGGTPTVSNTMKGRLVVRVSNLLVGEHAGKWFILAEKSGVKAVSVQKRGEPKLVRRDRPEDDNVFWKNKIYYGAKARGAAFCTLPFLAFGGGLADVPDATVGLPGVPKPEPETPPAG